MSAPVLSRRLVLEEATRLPDGAGGFVETWGALGTLWADVRPRTGNELGAGAAQVSRMRYRITVRAAPHGAPSRPRPEQRFRDGQRVYAITAVAERDAEGRWLTCFAEEEVSA